MTPITVNVTADDIAEGDPMNCLECPVALAMKRATGRFWRVDNDSIERQGFGFHCPEAVSEFVGRFDNGEPVIPFAFTVEVPDDYVQTAVSQ